MKSYLVLFVLLLLNYVVWAQEVKKEVQFNSHEKALFISLSDEEKSRLLENELMELTPALFHIYSKSDSLTLNWEPHPNVHHYIVEIREVSEKVYSDYRKYYPADLLAKKRSINNTISRPVLQIIGSGNDFWKGKQTVKRFWQVQAYDKNDELLCEGGCYSKYGSIVEFSLMKKTITDKSVIEKNAAGSVD